MLQACDHDEDATESDRSNGNEEWINGQRALSPTQHPRKGTIGLAPRSSATVARVIAVHAPGTQRERTHNDRKCSSLSSISFDPNFLAYCRLPLR